MPKKTLHRITIRSKFNGKETWLMVRARDAMDIITMLSGVLFGEDAEYDLIGINIIQDIRAEEETQ